ncbi:MAG: NCS2 family permease [Clostridia bacterium]|nr:NCS2 family permease [Clostridia bacterium]
MLDKIFKLKENNTNIKTEILAGFATFMSLCYIIFLTPNVLSSASGDARMYNAIFISTCIASCIGSLCTSLIANWPVVQAPGIGAVGFFTYTIMLKLGYSYPVALFINFVASFLFIICSVSGVREKVIKAIPNTLKTSLSVGIGIFIAFIGLKNGGIIVSNSDTMVGLVSFSSKTFGVSQIAAILTLFGVILIGILKHYNIKASVIITIITITILSIPLGVTSVNPSEFVSLGQMFSDFKDVALFANIKGLMEVCTLVKGSITALITLLILIFCFFLSDMFNSIGTLIAVSSAAKLKDEKGEIKGLSRALLCDAIGTSMGTCFGSPTVTSYLESGVGVSEGGKTGLTSFTTAILFLLAIVIGPFCNIIPSCATAPALIYVGILMLYQIREIVTDDILELIPATIAILFIPLTCDIAAGIALSFIAYTLLKIFTLKAKDVSIYMYIVSVLFIFYFALM